MCNTTLTKYLLFTFNLLFWLIGVFLLAIGVWAQADENFVNVILRVSGENQEPAENIAMYVNYMSLFIIALGGVITIIALFGCCGAIRESRCCLGVFFTLLLICFLVTVVFGGFLLFVAATGKSNDDTSKAIREAFHELVKVIWNAMTEENRHEFEKANHCCGIDASLGSIISKTKCAVTSGLVTENCQSKLIEKVQGTFFLSGGIILGVAVIEIIGMVMTCVLFNRFTHVYTAV